MVEKGHLYTERYSVGQFKLYFALENGEGHETVCVWDVDKGFKINVTAITIIPYNGSLEPEQEQSILLLKQSLK